MCDCSTRVQDGLLERFKDAQPTGSGHRVELQGYGFAIKGGQMVLLPYMPYKASADYPLKKGGTKWKTITGNMVFSFCPFCGDKLDKDQPA